MEVSTMDPTNSPFEAYRAMWSFFNAALFNGSLPPVILNFSRAANSLGFFAPLRWERGKETTHEISLNPSYLKRRSARDVASTLVHEMAHLWQLCRIRHNRHYAESRIMPRADAHS